MQKLTAIKFHGDLGNAIGKTWNFAVSSVGEAMHAIEIITGRKFFKYLLEKDKQGIKYKVLINQRTFLCPRPITLDDPNSIAESELMARVNNLESIDIVPVIEGADKGVIAAVLGVVLIVVGVVLSYFGGSGVPIIIAGIGLLAAGVITLLSKPPNFDDLGDIKGGGKVGYLYAGPENTTREGGPVPVGYGRLFVGSQVISASYDIYDIPATP